MFVVFVIFQSKFCYFFTHAPKVEFIPEECDTVQKDTNMVVPFG